MANQTHITVSSATVHLFYNGWKLSYFKHDQMTGGYWKMERPGYLTICGQTVQEVVRHALEAEKSKNLQFSDL